MLNQMLINVKDALLDSGFHKQLAQKVVLSVAGAIVSTTVTAVAAVVIKDIQTAIEASKQIEEATPLEIAA